MEIIASEVLREDGPHSPKRVAFGCDAVTVTFTERCYGGPEEGGWWFNRETPLRVYHVSHSQRSRLIRHLNRWVAEMNQGCRPLSSVLSDGEYGITMCHVPENFVRPEYS